ncbi:MAG: hypothetical protein K2H51_01640, partial [Malacoplasma sp.]|nr:hypothetical protein [Malacoplasma sp.]
MSKKEKVFSVKSRQDSKNFANEYLINKIRNNYHLIPGFNLEPVVENKVVVDNDLENSNTFTPAEIIPNPSYVADLNKNIDQKNAIKENQNLVYYDENIADSNVNNYYNQHTNNFNNEENQNLSTTALSRTSENYVNELNFNNLSSSSGYNNENYYSQNMANKDYSNSLNNSNDYYEETYQELVNNSNYVKENSNKLSNWNMKKNKEYELKDDSFEIEESENLQSLLNDYNMDTNILKDDGFDDETYFSYLSRKKIKAIISEKLGYCDEQMLDEIHSKAISENWKELDVQKWLLNPENINRFKEMNYDKSIDYPINFSSSEIDKSLFDLSAKHLDSINNNSNDTKVINSLTLNSNDSEYKLDNHKKYHNEDINKIDDFNKNDNHNHCNTKNH